MKTNKEINTNLMELSLAKLNAISEPTKDAELTKTLSLNIGTKVGEAQFTAAFMTAKLLEYVRTFREGLELSGVELFLFNINTHKHEDGKGVTMVGDVPISETTISVSLKTNLSLSSLKALVLGLTYALKQEAIPMLVEAQYSPTEVVRYGLMVGQTKQAAEKWGGFDSKFFIA